MNPQQQQRTPQMGKVSVAVFGHGTELTKVKSDIEDFMSSPGGKQVTSITTYLNQTTGEWSTIIIYQFFL